MKSGHDGRRNSPKIKRGRMNLDDQTRVRFERAGVDLIEVLFPARRKKVG